MPEDPAENPIARIRSIDFFYGKEGFLSLTDKGLVQRGLLTFEEWRLGLLLLLRLRDMFQVAASDLISIGKAHHGEVLVGEALGQMEFPMFEARKAEAIANVPWSARRTELTSEHLYVAGAADLKPAEREHWLETAVTEKLSPLELKRSIEIGKVEHTASTPTGKASGSGIVTIQAVRMLFLQWKRENEERILGADLEKQQRCLEELLPLAEFIDLLRANLTLTTTT